MRWARAEGGTWDGSVCAAAASAGRLDMLQWLRQAGCPWDKMTMAWAIVEGHKDVATWALNHGCDFSDESVMRLRMSKALGADLC